MQALELGFYLLLKLCQKSWPIVDKPLIQYAAEEAISAGIDTLIFVTGRHKRAIEDHFDSNMELDRILRASENINKPTW